ncbi:MAG: hypothetical protein ACXWIU_00470 [Limisphaerales bacterium]
MGLISKWIGVDDLANTIRERDTAKAVALELTKSAATRPIPVQSFPTVDDFRFESQKMAVAKLSRDVFSKMGSSFTERLGEAHAPVKKAMEELFAAIHAAHVAKNKQGDNPIKAYAEIYSKTELGKAGLELAGFSTEDKVATNLNRALDGLLSCSPKRIVAAFQKNALEAGWAFVSGYNCLIDHLAGEYPRCRGGIYGSRLNYSDVIQIADEILATLRATSTLIDDLQRRYDMLEALQAELRNDVNSTEISKICDAIYGSIKDTNAVGTSHTDAPWWKRLFNGAAELTGVKQMTSYLVGGLALLSAPGAQFQGQLAREQRVRVFFSTGLMLHEGWCEWSQQNEDIVLPNLRILFGLKSDYVANRIVSLCDLITANGYTLEKLPNQFDKLLRMEAPGGSN